MIGKEICIDTHTGNIIKRDYSCNVVQIWFCLYGKGAKEYCILNNGCNDSNNLKNFYNSVKKRKLINTLYDDYKDIEKYIEELQKKKLLSEAIEADNYKLISDTIEYMIKNHL